MRRNVNSAEHTTVELNVNFNLLRRKGWGSLSFPLEKANLNQVPPPIRSLYAPGFCKFDLSYYNAVLGRFFYILSFIIIIIGFPVSTRVHYDEILFSTHKTMHSAVLH